MNSLLSDRVNNLAESETLAMSRRSRELRQKGIDVINLSLGEPDFNTPEFIKDAAKSALDDNVTHYTPVPGILELRQAISKKFKRDNNLDYSPDQIVVSTGAKQSLANVVLSLINDGDEVILPVPYWVSYREIVGLAGGKIVPVHSGIDSNFKVDFSKLEEYITSKTKLIIFSSPCNPSGTVYSKEDLKQLADVLAKHPNIYVISDEIYEHISYTKTHESLGQFTEINDQLITVNGVSKGYAMTGWRIGYIGAPLHIAQAAGKIQGQVTSGTCSIAQVAARAAVEADPVVVKEMQDAFKFRRDLILDLIKAIPGMKCNVPEGAFYVFPEVSSYFGTEIDGLKISDSVDLCNYILEVGHVALVPGDAFGSPECIRISYAASEDQIREAVHRIKSVLEKLKKS
ncbi:MAG TPA: aspartate aminotransferase [Flavobacteriales bacterium]|nr:aspartate aminotransferase [Flavobacteriales bacterium]